MKNVLLVCSNDCRKLKARLASAGCAVIAVSEGTAAVSRPRHENVDTMILVSTGSGMDLTETALNLRDIHPTAQLILLTGRRHASTTAAELIPITRALPDTKIFSAADLIRYLRSRRSRVVQY